MFISCEEYNCQVSVMVYTTILFEKDDELFLYFLFDSVSVMVYTIVLYEKDDEFFLCFMFDSMHMKANDFNTLLCR